MADGCEIQGNNDLFGIGVRIGSYLQWLALIITNIANPTATQEVFKTVALFQLSFLVALVWNASTNVAQTHDVEAFVVASFGVGSGLAIATMHGNRHITRFTVGVTHLLALGFYVFSVWLWSSGLGTLVHMHGPVRYFCLATSALAVVGSLTSLSRLLLGLWYNRTHCRSWLLDPMSEPDPSQSLLKQHDAARYAVYAAQCLAFATFVLVAELSVTWNGITGVNNVMQTGQLIPLIVGLGVLVNVIWSCIFKTPESVYQ